MPVDIDKLAEGWLELESDPGLFTLLLEDFGVREVEVREVYDVSEQFWNEGLGDTRVFGFIFLFRWNPGRNRSRRKHLRSLTSLPVEYVEDKDVVNSIFFARQMVQNSCATHALLSVVLNCPDIDLGRTLDRLKDHTSGMDPENKGWAIANTPRLARDHNAHASPQAQRSPPPVTLSMTQQNPQGVQQVVKSRLALASSCTTSVTSETFHFVSYVPINGRLFELDGLKPFPVDHGPIGNDWTANFRKIIMNRLGIESKSGKFVTQDDEIHFSLMAVIPHQGASLVRKKARLQHWKTTFDSALNGLHLSEITETEAEEEKDRIAVLKAVMEEFHSSKQEQSLFSRSKTSSPNKPESSPALDCSWKVLQDFLKRGYEELLEEVKKLETGIKEEAEKQNKYRIDDARRVHNYDNFVTSFLTMLAEEGKLEPLIREQFAGRTDLVANSGLNSSDSKEAQVVAVKSVKRVMASRKAGQRKKKGRGRPKKAAYRK